MRCIYSLWFCCLVLTAMAQSNAPVPLSEKHLRQFPNLRDFTTDGEEAYFSAQSPLGDVSVILKMSKRGKKWSKPEIASFSGQHKDLEPFITPDGLTLYFASDRPSGSGDAGDFDIWYVSRSSKDDPWSNPVNMGEPVNSSFNEFYPVLTASNNLYFTTDARGQEGSDDIVVCIWDGEKYLDPGSVGPSINTAGYEFNAYVSPDESFMIFTGYNREGGSGSGDLYLSTRNKTGEWDDPENLGPEINSEHMDYCPFIFEHTLYYTSRRKDLSKPVGGFSSLKELLIEFNKYENGQSRIYQVNQPEITP